MRESSLGLVLESLRGGHSDEEGSVCCRVGGADVASEGTVVAGALVLLCLPEWVRALIRCSADRHSVAVWWNVGSRYRHYGRKKGR